MLILACIAGAVVVGSAAADPPTVGTPGQAAAGPGALIHPDGQPVEEPFTIRRLRATESQLSVVQKQLESGPIVRLPRPEFEARIRSAGRVAADSRLTPKITDARFKATLIGGDLVGTAEFEIVNPGSTSRLFALDPLRVALENATWGDGREAIVGVPSGGTTPAVWLDRAGRQTLKFGWSATGSTEPGERRFELRLPAAPTAVLVIELPDGQIPTVQAAEVLLTGPFPMVGNSGRSEWRIRFGGRSRLDIAVHPAGNPGVPASATLAARYELTPGQLTCRYEYELRPATGTVGEWMFTIDPGLRIADVVMNNRSNWVVDPPTTPKGPRKLRVTLRQPGAGGKIFISAVAPFPDSLQPNLGSLPGVRPVGAILDDESLELRVAPGLKIENWNPGDYRLTDSQTLADQTQSLTLTGTLVPQGINQAYRRLPILATSDTEHEFTSHEELSWRFETDRVTAGLRVTLRVRRGPMFGFAMKIPTGYTFSRVASTPDELVSYTGSNANTLMIEFARPLTTNQSAELHLEFRGPGLVPGSHRLPIPAFTPLGVRERVGVIGISPGSVWKAELWTGAGTRQAGWLEQILAMPPTDATTVLRYSGSDPEGGVLLSSAKPEFTVTKIPSSQRNPLGDGDDLVFTVDIQAGVISGLIVADTTEGKIERTWTVVDGGNAITSAIEVPVNVIIQHCMRSANLWPVKFWMLVFARPATDEIQIRTTSKRGSDLRVGGAGKLVILGASNYRVHSVPDAKPVQKVAPYSAWAFEGLYQVTAVRTPSDVVVVFGGSVSEAGGNILPVTLPQGAEVRAVAVGGKWVTPGSIQMSSTGVVELPIPLETPVRFEVRYRIATSPSGPVVSVHSPEPKLPGAGEVKRWWGFSSSVLPGWPVRPWDRGTSADLPQFMGAIPLSGSGVVVSRSQDETIRIAAAGTADSIGVGLAGILLALGWAGGRRRHFFCGFLLLLALFAVAIVNQIGPPWWQRAALSPLVVGLVVAGVMVVVRGHRTRVITAVTFAAILVIMIESETFAQPAGPATVILLPPDSEGRETVVVPKAVIDRLAAILPTAPGVMITTAEYKAVAEESVARVTAKFIAHAISSSDLVASLTLPDARLERVTVNGTNSFPTTTRPGVYSLPLPSVGRHEIEVRFTVAITGTSPEREIRFGVPEVPASRVVVDLPGGAKQAQVMGRLGRQSVQQGGRVRVEADLGAGKFFQVRWRDGVGGTATLKVREGCIWDLMENGAELTACYLVRVEQGTVSTLKLELPSELEPLSLVIRPIDMGGVAALRDWSIGPDQGGFRSLRLDLKEATSGRLLVVLSLSPRTVITRQPVLRFPRFVLPGANTAEIDATYGLRAKGVVIEEIGRGGVIDFSPDSLTREFAGVVELRLDPNALVRVFRPTTRGNAELRPTLRTVSEPPSFTLDTVWGVTNQRAVATGTVKWSAKDGQSFLEFSLPGVKVTELRGGDIAGWSNPDGRVQIWLKKPSKEGEVAWSGIVAAPASPFEARTPRPQDGRLTSDTVRVRPAQGFSLAVERDRGWTHTATYGEFISYRTSSIAFPPVRVSLTQTTPTLGATELGWLSPGHHRTHIADPPPPKVQNPSVQTRARPSQTQELTEPPRWIWPVSAAVGWGATVLLLIVLMARFPRWTWPEQLGLVGGLLGVVAAQGWWVGIPLWFIGRGVWLMEVIARGLKPRA